MSDWCPPAMPIMDICCTCELPIFFDENAVWIQPDGGVERIYHERCCPEECGSCHGNGCDECLDDMEFDCD